MHQYLWLAVLQFVAGTNWAYPQDVKSVYRMALASPTLHRIVKSKIPHLNHCAAMVVTMGQSCSSYGRKNLNFQRSISTAELLMCWSSYHFTNFTFDKPLTPFPFVFHSWHIMTLRLNVASMGWTTKSAEDVRQEMLYILDKMTNIASYDVQILSSVYDRFRSSTDWFAGFVAAMLTTSKCSQIRLDEGAFHVLTSSGTDFSVLDDGFYYLAVACDLTLRQIIDTFIVRRVPMDYFQFKSRKEGLDRNILRAREICRRMRELPTNGLETLSLWDNTEVDLSACSTLEQVCGVMKAYYGGKQSRGKATEIYKAYSERKRSLAVGGGGAAKKARTG